MADPHETHDMELIAALLDRDMPEAERMVAQVRLAACPACATLHADLMALTQATAELPTPARPRGFTLAPEVAANLTREAAWEPAGSSSRLTREMHDSRSTHGAHDRLLIANLVDRFVDDAERARAEEQLAACSECELLYDDLVALSAATRAMPVPARPREFILTRADAERLRVRGWRRVLAAIGSTRDVFSRPLAVGLTTLGLAGLLVATIPTALTGPEGPTAQSTVENAVGDAAGGAATNPEIKSGQASAAPPGPAAIAADPLAAPSAAAEALPLPSGETGTSRQETDGLFVGGESSPLAGEPDGQDLSRDTILSYEAPFARSTTIVIAGLLLAVGLGLFALRWTSRRLGDR